jgi:hypothetical protein
LLPNDRLVESDAKQLDGRKGKGGGRKEINITTKRKIAGQVTSSEFRAKDTPRTS